LALVEMLAEAVVEEGVAIMVVAEEDLMVVAGVRVGHPVS